MNIFNKIKKQSIEKENISFIFFIIMSIILVIYISIPLNIPKLFNEFLGIIIVNVFLIALFNFIVGSNIQRCKNFSEISKKILIIIMALALTVEIQLVSTYPTFKISTEDIKYDIAVIKDTFQRDTSVYVGNAGSISIWVEKTGRRMYSPKIAKIRYDGHVSKIPNEYFLQESLKTLQRYNDKITIEYYNNSKLIKTINGEDIWTNEGKIAIVKRAEYLKKIEREKTLAEFQERKKDKEQEEKRQQELAQESRTKQKNEVEIISNAIGKDITVVEKEFEDNNLEKYKVNYVSSKMGQINSIIYLDYVESVFYVIKDNNNEDMVAFPELKIGMSKDEVKKILDDKNIKYIFYSNVYTDDNTKADTLARIPVAYGRIIPKDVTVGIELYVYNKKN